MPKKQNTAAKKARAAARDTGAKYTTALRDALADDDPAPELATVGYSDACGECGGGGDGYACHCPPVCNECGGDMDSGYGCHCDDLPAYGDDGQGDREDDEDLQTDLAIQAWKDDRAMGYTDADGQPIEPEPPEPDHDDFGDEG